MKTFKHSGDMGDIIFSLPTIKALGGGILLLDPDGGEICPLVKWADRTRTKLNKESIDFLRPLLEYQPYIEMVDYWDGRKVDYDLDEFRKHIKYNNLADSHLAAFNLPLGNRDFRWLDFDQKWKEEAVNKPLLISRTPRYHGNFGFWEAFLGDSNHKPYEDKMAFIGHKKEHEIFEYTFGKQVPYYETPTVQSIIGAIMNCQVLVTNQGFIHSLGEGMKKGDMLTELYRVYPSVVFKRDGVMYV